METSRPQCDTLSSFNAVSIEIPSLWLQHTSDGVGRGPVGRFESMERTPSGVIKLKSNFPFLAKREKSIESMTLLVHVCCILRLVVG